MMKKLSERMVHSGFL